MAIYELNEYTTYAYLPLPFSEEPVLVARCRSTADVAFLQYRLFLLRLNLCREADRRLTYTWHGIGQDAQSLREAEHGFFCLGNPDHRQCFSCGRIFIISMENEDAIEEHERASPPCAMPLGMESRNIPFVRSEVSNNCFSFQCFCITTVQRRKRHGKFNKKLEVICTVAKQCMGFIKHSFVLLTWRPVNVRSDSWLQVFSISSPPQPAHIVRFPWM